MASSEDHRDGHPIHSINSARSGRWLHLPGWDRQEGVLWGIRRHLVSQAMLGRGVSVLRCDFCAPFPHVRQNRLQKTA